MIEVIVYSQNAVANWAECETPEDAVRCGQILWDESWDPCFSRSRKISFYVDGKLTVTSDRRPE